MDTIIVTANKKQSKIVRDFLESQKVKFAVTSESNIESKEKSPYNPEFVEMILRSSQQAKEGKITKIALEDLWK